MTLDHAIQSDRALVLLAEQRRWEHTCDAAFRVDLAKADEFQARADRAADAFDCATPETTRGVIAKLIRAAVYWQELPVHAHECRKAARRIACEGVTKDGAKLVRCLQHVAEINGFPAAALVLRTAADGAEHMAEDAPAESAPARPGLSPGRRASAL